MLGKHSLHPDPARRKHQAQHGIQANSVWCLETCSCVLQLLHSVSGGEEIFILWIPIRAFLWSVCWVWLSALLLMPVLDRMLFHLASEYSCVFQRVRGMDEAEKLWINCTAKEFFFQSPVCVISLPRL